MEKKPFVRNYMPKRNPNRRIIRGIVLTATALVLFCILRLSSIGYSRFEFNFVSRPLYPEIYPVAHTLRLPRSRPVKIPKIQHEFAPETIEAKELRMKRLREVREHFLYAWEGYKKEAWAQDELRPNAGGYKTPFCGWAATMVDSLDTLLIMGLQDEFQTALRELEKIDFTNTEGCMINLFETTIRHLGGLLAAYDLSGGKYTLLVEKAVELAEILYTAFDTPNRMPAPHYLWSAKANETEDRIHVASRSVVVAVLGSLSLEFTRLAQITGNDKYFDAIQRVMNELEKWQSQTILPGMWPTMVDSTVVNETIALKAPYAGSGDFSLGALADSTYEYLPKQYMMLGGQSKEYRRMYENFIGVAKKHLFFRPMTVGEEDLLVSGTAQVSLGSQPSLKPDLQHLTCFTGGMLAIAGKIFERPEDFKDGARLTDGCVWAYKSTVTGIMPETVLLVPCDDRSNCPWDAKKWFAAVDPDADEEVVREEIKQLRLSPGFARVQDGRYLLRPEAIESVFIMWRTTGDSYWTDSGWNMFKSIVSHTKTDIAHSAIDDVTSGAPRQVDEMESFWLAETLKYFYLLYSEPNVISLDEFVLNTEAHPLRRPV